MMPRDFGTNFNRFSNFYSLEFDSHSELVSFVQSIRFAIEIVSINESSGKFVLFFNSSKKLIFKKG